MPDHRTALLFMNGGLGNGVILAPVLADLEAAFPQLTYYAPYNAMLGDPWLTSALDFTGPRGELPELWRRFRPADYEAMIGFGGATFVINLRKEAAEQDGDYFRFCDRAAAAGIECWDLHELESGQLGLPIGMQAAEVLRRHGVPERSRRRAWALPRCQPRTGVVGLCVGASVPVKRWPAQHWSVVAGELLRRGLQVEAAAGLDEQERALARELAAEHPGGVRLRLPESPAQWIDWVTGLPALISNDTLAVHLAAALGRPVVALYLTTDGRIWAPLAEPGTLSVMQSQAALDCPSMKVDGTCHQFYGECRTACGAGITPEAVLHGLDLLTERENT